MAKIRIKSNRLSDNIVRHFKMNDNLATTNIVDSIGGDGTLIGGDNTEDLSQEGKIHKALLLDGTSDYMTFGDGDVPIGSDACSVTAWVYLTAVSVAWMGVVGYGDNTASNHRIFGFGGADVPERSKLHFGIYAQNATSPSNTEISTGTWHHVGWTVSSGGTVTYYLDGNADGSGTVTGMNTIAGSGYMGISYNGGAKLNGAIDDVRIYDKVLTLAEIQSIYNGGRGTESENPTVPAKIVVNSTEMLIDPGVENWTGDTPDDWTKTESGGGTIEEEGTIVHSGSHCAKFLQVTGGFPRLSQAVSFVAGTTYEISLWINGVGGGNGYKINTYGNSGGSIVIGSALTLTNDWVEHRFLYTAVAGANLLMIAPNNSTNYNFYVDDVSIKKAGNIALTNTWDVSDAIVAQYKLNDNLATTVVVDEEGTNGVLLAAETTADKSIEGVINKGFSFTGANDGIDTQQEFISLHQSDWSIACWIACDDGQSGDWQFPFGNGSADDLSEITIGATGKIGYYLKIANVVAFAESASAVLPNGATGWFHFVATISETQITIYYNGAVVTLDGTNDGDTSGLTFGDYAGDGNDFYIGARNNGGTAIYDLAGSMDNFCLFNRVLTVKEIQGLYNNGRGTEKLKDLG